MPDSVAVPLNPWDAFVDRFGVTAHVALVAAIASISLVIMNDPPRAESVPGLQMLLVLIALGCVAVLSYRSHDA